MRTRVILMAGIVLAAASAHAAEPSKQQCLDANAKAQELRRAGRLREARVQLALCTASSCPAVVRGDCGQWLTEVDAALPSIVFEAKDGDGGDLSAVKVTMDGAALIEKLDGSPIAVDPGEHRFVFEASGKPRVEKRVVVSQGQKGRRERVTLGAPTAATLEVSTGNTGDVIHVDDRVVGSGRWQGSLPAGTHHLTVTAAGKRSYEADVQLAGGERRTLNVTLTGEGKPLWPWIVGGAVLVAGAGVGAYVLLRPLPAEQEPPPSGALGTVHLSWAR
jgi:hypothetical protein